jgi:hypothetical protein
VRDSLPFLSQTGNELPESYGEWRVTLLAVNSYLVYVYWDFQAAALPDPVPPATLRFHDVTDGSVGDCFEVPVDLAARNWYVPLWSPARSYYVELGWNDEGEFRPLVKSNTVETPRAWPVTAVEPHLIGITAALPRPVPESPDTADPFTSSAEGNSQETLASPRLDAAFVLRRKLEEIYVAHGAFSLPVPIEESHLPPVITAEPTMPPPAGTPETSAEETKEAGAPLAVEPRPAVPVDAAETLRRRLEEIYELQGVQAGPMAALETSADGPAEIRKPKLEGVCVAAEVATPVSLAAAPSVLAPVEPRTAGDLTAQAEERFSPGHSSTFPATANSGEPKV